MSYNSKEIELVLFPLGGRITDRTFGIPKNRLDDHIKFYLEEIKGGREPSQILFVTSGPGQSEKRKKYIESTLTQRGIPEESLYVERLLDKLTNEEPASTPGEALEFTRFLLENDFDLQKCSIDVRTEDYAIERTENIFEAVIPSVISRNYAAVLSNLNPRQMTAYKAEEKFVKNPLDRWIVLFGVKNNYQFARERIEKFKPLTRRLRIIQSYLESLGGKLGFF